MPIIRAEKIEIAYQTTSVIQELTLSIECGTMISLVGPNGSGKSTLLKALAGQIRLKDGKAFLDEQEIRHTGSRATARRLSFLPQAPLVPEGLSVRELVALGRFPHLGFTGLRSQEDERAIDHAMEMASVKELSARPAEQLSGGQRQRVWIAMTLAQQSDILFLDEPTTYLDISHQIEVLDLLQHMNRDYRRTVVMVLHDLNLAARYSDRIIALRDGTIHADDTPSRVVTPKILEQVFGIQAEIHIDSATGRPWFIPGRLLPLRTDKTS